jgi:hypothetical protein
MTQEIIYKASRLKLLFPLLGYAGVAAAGILMVRDSNHGGWMWIAFFGPATVIQLRMMFSKKMYLKLDSEGIEIGSTVRRPQRINWGDFLYSNTQSYRWHTWIVINYQGEHAARPLPNKPAKMSGKNRNILSIFKASPEDISETIEYRANCFRHGEPRPYKLTCNAKRSLARLAKRKRKGR